MVLVKSGLGLLRIYGFIISVMSMLRVVFYSPTVGTGLAYLYGPAGFTLSNKSNTVQPMLQVMFYSPTVGTDLAYWYGPS